MFLDAYIAEWLDLLLRWAHVITGIAWIGSSFYFMWLDARLNVPPRDPENRDVAGDLWAVHGGGFYHSQKYKVAPGELPEPLHWFKWEAYFTWITGFLLLIVVYYLNADVYLIDSRIADISSGAAIAASVGLLLVGWYVYCGLCALRVSDGWIALIGSGYVLGLCWGLSNFYSGRGMFVQAGAMLGTIMAANVWRVIIPSQKQLVMAIQQDVKPDATLGMKAKRRSVHNNYLTLPVVFVMISPHYAMTYGHAWNWLILFAIFVVGVLVRHYFNLRNRGSNVVAWPIAAAVVVIILAIAIAPRGSPSSRFESNLALPDRAVAFEEVRDIIEARCLACHSSEPSHPTAPVPAGGVVFDSPRVISVWSGRIYERAVRTGTMPPANTTQMTDTERAILAKWISDGAGVE